MPNDHKIARQDGGPAFPSTINFDDGMSLRDFFAAMAMAGQASYEGSNPAQIKGAYEIADMMLAERAK